MKHLKSSNISGILAILVFIFNLLIFAPIEIYCTNEQEFWFDLSDILPVIFILSLITLGGLLLILKVIKKNKRHIFVRVLTILTIGLYIQGNFMNFGYGKLDGRVILWNEMILKGIINTVIWLAIIAFSFCIKKLRNKEFFYIFASITSIAIILIQTSTLSVLLINKDNSNSKNIGLVNTNIFNFSKENNIVVIMADTFEGEYMNDVLRRNAEIKEKLKDFTYYDNCTGTSFFTFSSMPMLMTGEECLVGNNLEENMEYTFSKTEMYDVLKANNYDSELYVEKALEPQNAEIANLKYYNKETTNETKIKLSKNMYKYVLFRYLPHFLKSNFVPSSQEFIKIKTQDHLSEYKEKTYFLDDVELNKELVKNGATATQDKNVFKFYQINGVHYPYDTTQEIEYDESKEYGRKSSNVRRFNEEVATINLLSNYVEELKKTGAYDNTTIILLADHGFDNRFWTTLLVKKANANHDFEINSAPISLLEDLKPTILNIATNSKDYGKDFFDYTEGEARTREVYDYTYQTNGENSYKVLSKMVFQTEGFAEEKDKFYMISEEYENEDKELTKKYKFGETLNVEQMRESNKIKVTGFALEDIGITVSKGTNINNTATIIVNAKEAQRDVIFDIGLASVYGMRQTIKLKVNGEEIESKVANKMLSESISFNIPKDIWNKEKQVEIILEFPDAKLGTYYATTMSAICMETIKFTENN